MVKGGFYAACSDPVSIDVPTRSSYVVIFNPSINAIIIVNVTIRLYGICTSSLVKSVDVESATWLIENEQVGTGFDIFVAIPAKGKRQ